MSQIQKERQLESLVEKICKRMQTSESDRQCYDLAYCLSLLHWSDRSLRRLLDLANCYADKLTSPSVASLFQQIGSNAVKSTKPGVKVCILLLTNHQIFCLQTFVIENRKYPQGL